MAGARQAISRVVQDAAREQQRLSTCGARFGDEGAVGKVLTCTDDGGVLAVPEAVVHCVRVLAAESTQSVRKVVARSSSARLGPQAVAGNVGHRALGNLAGRFQANDVAWNVKADAVGGPP